MNSRMYREILDQPEVLERVINNFNGVEDVLKAALKGKKKLFLLGSGASLNACYAAIHAFVNYMSIHPLVLPASEAENYINLFDDESFIIVLSQSGESYETKNLCEIFIEKNIPFCGITNNPDSTLGRTAGVVLDTKAGEEISSATKTQTASLLYLYLISRCGAEDKDRFEELVDAVRNTACTSRETIGDIAEAIRLEQTMFILSDGLNYATARQGALLLKEKVLICAEGMTVTEFRHGAIEVARKGLTALLISTEERSHEEFEKHAAFMKELEMNLFSISNAPFKHIPPGNAVLVPKIETEPFSPLIATVPLQLLAERAAYLNGYDVDGFIHLSKVVENY